LVGWFGPGGGFGRREHAGSWLYTRGARGFVAVRGGGGGTLARGPGRVRCDLRRRRLVWLAGGARRSVGVRDDFMFGGKVLCWALQLNYI
jgi:hypothetical protein